MHVTTGYERLLQCSYPTVIENKFQNSSTLLFRGLGAWFPSDLVKEPLPEEIDEDHVGGLAPEQVHGQAGHAQRTSDGAQELRAHEELDGKPEEMLQKKEKKNIQKVEI
jgi:hypothetical protein